MAADNRPLSPHLQVYRPQITSVLSISHRISGVFMAAGLLVLVYWLSALAAGPARYADALDVIGSWPVQLLLFGWTLAFFYHFLNGIRHLIWDTGRGFEIDQVTRSGRVVVAAAGLLTLLFWFGVRMGGGA
jgi:succinate dehydrogenase / fumarate reductase cytochrome b subunit